MNARAVVLAATLLLGSCVTFSFERDLRYVPLADGVLEGLHPGEARLDQCIERLGAPLYVWEYKGNGMALAYGWEKEKAWTVTVSVPVTNYYSASGAYTNNAAKLRGAVLLFDSDLKLETVRRGFLRTLRAEIENRRPAPVDEEAEAEAAYPPRRKP